MASLIQFKRANREYLENYTEVFAAGEPIFEKDTGRLKIGNGFDTYNDLKYVGDGKREADGKSITINDGNILSLFGFNEASDGYILSKGSDGKLQWVSRGVASGDYDDSELRGLISDIKEHLGERPEGEIETVEARLTVMSNDIKLTNSRLLVVEDKIKELEKLLAVKNLKAGKAITITEGETDTTIAVNQEELDEMTAEDISAICHD